MKEERKREINEMANAIGGKNPGDDFSLIKTTLHGTSVVKSTKEIMATKKLEIPKTALCPTNGRIYVVSVAGNDMKTPGGLILPPTFAMQKNDQVEGVQRYFVVAWDTHEIPANIQQYLSVGIEVNPFLPWEAQDWKLPRVVDWETGNIFDVIHYTELAGISLNKPKPVE
jgi:hypothetical protein